MRKILTPGAEDDPGRESSDPSPRSIRRVVVIASYDEMDNLAQLIPEITALTPSFHVLVVDDSSPDGTGEYVAQMARENPLVHLLSRPAKLGYGTAIVDGFRQALVMGADRIFTMDADHSHNPRDLVGLDRALERFDLVIGSRYRGGIRILNWSLSRLLLSLGANYYVRILLQLKYTDCTSGFRAYRREVVAELSRDKANSRGYAFLVEILNRVQQSGYRIGEIPIVYTERRAGQSKMSRRTIWEAAWRPWMILLGRRPGRAGR